MSSCESLTARILVGGFGFFAGVCVYYCRTYYKAVVARRHLEKKRSKMTPPGSQTLRSPGGSCSFFHFIDFKKGKAAFDLYGRITLYRVISVRRTDWGSHNCIIPSHDYLPIIQFRAGRLKDLIAIASWIRSKRTDMRGMHAAHRGAVGGQRRHSPLLGTLLNIQLVVPRMVRVRGARARRSRHGAVRAATA